MSLRAELEHRSENACELCTSPTNLETYEVPPSSGSGVEKSVLICNVCSDQINHPATMDVHHWQQVNPVLTEALVHLTTGGPQTVYWGGLATGRLRYYDAGRRRPGLPMDVAALVRELHAESVTVTLVNLSVRDRHDVIVGAGSFSEHCFTHAGVVEQDNRDRKSVV